MNNLNVDPNPVVVRKKPGPVQYTQEIGVRFLKPPPPPQPGRIIIRQEPDIILPPPPPLVIRKYYNVVQQPEVCTVTRYCAPRAEVLPAIVENRCL